MEWFPKAKFDDFWRIYAGWNYAFVESPGRALRRGLGAYFLALLVLLGLGGFVVFLDVRDFGEPVVFAVDGTHVADEGV